MKTTSTRSILAASIIGLVSLAGSAHGAITINIAEVGSDVVLTYTGNLDLTDIYLADSYANPGGGQSITPGSSSFAIGTSPYMDVYTHHGDTGITVFGTGTSQIYADTSTGDLFACMAFGTSYNLFLPGDYDFVSNLSGTSTWNDTTLAEMGLIPGSSHGFTLPHDTFTVNIGSSIPEPSTAGLLGLLTATGLFNRRRRA